MTSSLIDRLNAVSEQVALKRPVRLATTANIALSGFQAIDGVTPGAADGNLRILVKNQATPSENGIYRMATGAWERADDFDGNRDVVKGTRVPVTEGNIGANKTYVVTAADPIVIDTTAITFSEITESLVTTEFAKPRAPLRSISANTTLTVSDAGRQIDVDCSGADVVVTLPAALDLADGDRLTVRYAAGTNQVTLACQGSDAINGASAIALTARYESLTLSTNGAANWSVIGHARPFAIGGVTFIKVASRTLTIPPVSPAPGARYIIAASGTPAGDWSAYANNDVVESNGQGGWIRYTPSESWHAYVEAENKLVFFTGAAWQGLPNTDNPAQSDLGYAHFRYAPPNATEGGTIAAGSWTARTLDETVSNTIAGCTLASNTVTLPAGKYLVIADAAFYIAGETQIRFKSTTTAAALYGPQTYNQVALIGDISHLVGVLSLPAQEAFKLEYWATITTGGTSGLGRSIAGNAGDGKEYYTTVQILDLASLEGPQGDMGEQGPQGFTGFKYQYSDSIAIADPGPGTIRLNGSIAAATAAAIDDLSAETGNPDVSAEILAWGGLGGILKIAKVGAEQNFATFNVTAVTDHPGWIQLTLTSRASAGSISNADAVSLQFAGKGETGASGSSFPVYDYAFNTAVAGDPGSGRILFDNVDLSLASAVSIHDLDRIAVDRSADVGAFDDNGAAGNRGTLYLVNADTAARVAAFRLTGAITDNTTYQTMPATWVSGAAPADNTRVALMFVPAGATGAIGGDTGATDMAILRASGAGGTALQNSPNTIANDGKMTINLSSTAANAVGSGLKVSHATSGSPGAGIGVAIELETEAAGGNVVGGQIESVATTVTASTEDFDIVFRTRSGGALTERMRLKDGGNLELGSSAAFALKASGQQALTGGFTVATPYNIGSVASSTVTPSGSNGQLQYLTNNGAFQINPPAADTAIDILITNSSNAGTIAFSSAFKVGASAGDALTSVNGSMAMVSIQRINGVSTYSTRLLTTF